MFHVPSGPAVLHLADGLGDALHAVLRLRVRGEPVGHAVAIARLGNPRERHEERGHLLRIPPALRGVLRAQRIGLQLVVATEFHEHHAGADFGEIGKRRDLRNEDAADEHAKRRAHAARVLRRRMARRHVTDFVSEDPDQLRFVVQIREDAARDVDEPARQREGVDRRRIDNREAPRKIRPLGALREPHPELLHVSLQLVVLVQAHLLAHLRIELAAEADLLLLAHEGDLALAGHRIGGARRQQNRGDKGEEESHGRFSVSVSVLSFSFQPPSPGDTATG